MPSKQAIKSSLHFRSYPHSLSLYIFREFILALLCALLAFSLLFLLNDIFDDVSDFSSRAIPLRVVLSYFLYKLPLNMAHVIPVSVLLSVSFMTIILGKNNELQAMRSAGLSLSLCITPVWITALFFSVVSFTISEKISPACSQKIENIQAEWLSGKKTKQQSQLAYKYSIEGRDWFFSKFYAEGKSEGVIIRQHNEDKSLEWIISCRQAEYKDGKWLFYEGEKYTFSLDEENLLIRSPAEFFSVRTESFPEYPELIKEGSISFEQLNIGQIWRLLRSDSIRSDRLKNALWSMFWHRLFFPLSSLVAAMFAFSLSQARGRSSYMKGFAFALAAVVLFFISGHLFLVLGKNNWLSPFIAGAFLPIAFTLAGVFLLYQRQ